MRPGVCPVADEMLIGSARHRVGAWTGTGTAPKEATMGREGEKRETERDGADWLTGCGADRGARAKAV